MTKPAWTLKEPIISHGEPGVSVSDEVLRKACAVLDAFYAFIGRYEIEIEEDCDQGVTVIGLRNGFVLAIDNAEKDRVGLMDERSGWIGYLEREHDD